MAEIEPQRLWATYRAERHLRHSMAAQTDGKIAEQIGRFADDLVIALDRG